MDITSDQSRRQDDLSENVWTNDKRKDGGVLCLSCAGPFHLAKKSRLIALVVKRRF